LTSDGSSWSSPEDLGLPGLLEDVSCASAGFCVAVSLLGGYAVWHGSSWTTATASLTFTAISCPAVDACVALDPHGDAVRFDGTSWSDPIGSGDEMTGISCATPAWCLGIDTSGDSRVLTGKGWTDDRIHIGQNARRHVQAVSCASRSF